MLPYIQSLNKVTKTLPKWINKFNKAEGLRSLYRNKLHFYYLLLMLWPFSRWAASHTLQPPGLPAPGSSVLRCLLELAQMHVHWAGDTVQPSHALRPPSPSAFGLSQDQHLFWWVGVSPQVAKVLEFHLHQRFCQRIFKVDSPLGLTGLIFLQTKEVKIIFPSTTVYRHQSFNTQPSLWSNSHICTWVLGKP